MSKPIPTSCPTFDNVDDHRQYLKQRLAAAFRLFGKFGFSEGVAGHITARDPELPDHFWVNPFAVDFSLIKASDLILVNHDGEVVEGDYDVNRAAFAIHSQVHAARPDVQAAAHAHSVHGKAFSSLGQPARPAHPGRRARSTATTPCSTTTPASCSTPRRASASATPWARTRPSSCATTACSPWATRSTRRPGGSSPWSAPARPSCWPWPPATPMLIDPEMAAMTQTQVGGHLAGWLSFQPLYEQIVRDQPDLLD